MNASFILKIKSLKITPAILCELKSQFKFIDTSKIQMVLRYRNKTFLLHTLKKSFE